jgi:hypothetical protein
MASFTRTALSHHSPTASFGSKPPPTDGDEAASFPMQRILPHRDVERGGVGEEEGEEEEESDEESEGEHAYDADGMQSRHSFDTKQQPAESDLRARILFGVVLALLFLVGLYMQLEVFDWHPVGVVSVVWTTPNSGFLHLAQWLVVRRLANIRFTHLRAVARSSQDQEDQEGREGSQQQRWQLLSNWTAEPSTSRPDNHSLPIIQVFVLDIVNERVDVSTMDASAGDPEPLDHALSKILHSSAYMSLPHLFYLRQSVYADRLFSLLDRSFDVHRFDWEPGQEGFHKHWPPSVFSTLVATEQQRLSLMAEAQERSDLMMHIAETMTADRAKDTSKEPPPAVHLISSESFRQHTLPAVIASARHVLRHLRVLPPVSQHPEVSRLLTKDSYLLSFQHTWYDHSEFLLRQVMTVAQAEVRPPEAMQLEWDRLRALESRAHERSLAVFPKEEVLPCLTCGDMTTPLVFEHDAFYADLLFSSEGLDSFDYIARNRVCAATGTIPEETYTRTFPLSGAPSGHTPEFDQNFHRIWNNDVRMNFYHQPSATNSIDRHADRLVRDEPQRCGLLSPTTLDLAREYVEAIEMSNRHCDLTIVTAITDCYESVTHTARTPESYRCALVCLDRIVADILGVFLLSLFSPPVISPSSTPAVSIPLSPSALWRSSTHAPRKPCSSKVCIMASGSSGTCRRSPSRLSTSPRRSSARSARRSPTVSSRCHDGSSGRMGKGGSI